MGKIQIAISTDTSRGKQQAKHTRKLGEISDLKRIDAILVHQHVLRRFKSRHRSQYDALFAMRTELDRFLAEKGFAISQNQELAISRPKMLAHLMNFCWRKRNVELLQTDTVDDICERLEEHILDFTNRNFRNPLIGSPDLPHLARILARYSTDIAEMHQRLNYFVYYSPYSLTSEISGKKLYTHFILAQTGRIPISSSSLSPARVVQWKSGSKALGSDEIEDTPHKSARWLYTEEAAQDPDLSALVETRCYLPSSQVDAKVFAGWETEIVINGIKADNHLILAIPITEFPARIDVIMEEFREALLHELIKRTTFDGENIDKAESFYASAFANTLSHHTCLIDSFGGIQMILLGLWAWDLVQREEERAERVSDAVRKGMEDLKIKLGKPPGILIPEPDSIRKNGYDKVVATVGSASGTQRKPKSSRIDRYLTSSRSVVLGPVG